MKVGHSCCILKSYEGEFQLMQILGLLGMYFDDGVVEVEKYLIFFRLALASAVVILFLLAG